MRKDPIKNQVTLDFTDLIIKGAIKVRANIQEAKGWMRIDDFHIKSGETIPSPNNKEDWAKFLKSHTEISQAITDIDGGIIEVYENYEGYLHFFEDIEFGEVSSEEIEEIYRGEHFG